MTYVVQYFCAKTNSWLTFCSYDADSVWNATPAAQWAADKVAALQAQNVQARVVTQ